MFASSIGFRGAGIVLALVLPLVGERADAACNNIVALSGGQGRVEYMVLDPATLAILRVGDLGWLGFHSVNFVARGSSFERSVINSFDYLRVNSEEPVIAADNPGPYTSSAFTLLSLENLGENLRSQDDIPTMDSGSQMTEASDRIEWADWIQGNTLIREIYDPEQYFVEGYELLDTDFNVLRRWEPRVRFTMERYGLPSCLIDDSLYFYYRGSVQVFDDQGQGGTIYELEDLQNEGLRLVLAHTKNCKALAFRDDSDDGPTFRAVLADIVTGTWGPEFEVTRFGDMILYDDGRHLLQQWREGTIHSPSNPRARYVSLGDPINRFDLIDTTTGEVLLERELETGTGLLSLEMLCDEETPRALVQEGDRMHLIDPNTLEITASRTMPEGWGWYSVFE